MTCSELKVMQIDTMQPGLLKRDFSHGCSAAVNTILTDIARRAVLLRQRSLLLSIIFAVVNQGPIR